MPGTRNNCLLHALTYNNGAPSDMVQLRQEIVRTACKHRDCDYEGIKLEEWVEITASKSFDVWVQDFIENDEMSDQIVLRLWPLYRGESVWLWNVTQTGGYEHRRVLRFGESQIVRHVCYRMDELHYNALELREGISLDD